jgi:hypothetical protein
MTDGLDQKAGAARRVCAHLDGCLGRLWLRRGEVGGEEACNRARTLPAWGSWPRGDSTGDAGSAGLVCPDDGCEQRRGETGEAGEIMGRETVGAWAGGGTTGGAAEHWSGCPAAVAMHVTLRTSSVMHNESAIMAGRTPVLVDQPH